MTVLVVGLGKSGLAACALLAQRGDRVFATDLNPTPNALDQLKAMNVTFTESFVDSDLTVVSPGVPLDLPELEGRTVIGELELAFPYIKGPIIGVTGSNGKTTTTALIGHTLTAAGIPNQVGGNIGIPPAAMITSSQDDQWNVLELSSFQLETTQSFRPHIGVCLNVTPNHLDRHHTLAKYAEAKARMFQEQVESDFKVLNAADETCLTFGEMGSAETHWFNRGEHPLELTSLALPGRHNWENAWAATLVCRLAGAGSDEIRQGLHTFPGVEHRLEFVSEIDGVRYYNDSKATSVDATLKAIAALQGPLWIILGGKDKGSDYHPLIAPLKDRARGVLLVGDAAAKIASQLADDLPVHHSHTIESALEKAHQEATDGDIILLAPACASFDQFRSFEHRGDVFKSLVRQLEKQK